MSSDIGNLQNGVLHQLTLDIQVPLLDVRSCVVEVCCAGSATRILESGWRHRREPIGDSSSWKTGRIILRGAAEEATRVESEFHIVLICLLVEEDSESAAKNKIIFQRRVGESEARREIVPVGDHACRTTHSRHARSYELTGREEI